MSRVLLDTTFLVDAERAEPDLDEAIRDEDDVAIAAITVAELLVGVELATAKRRADRAGYVDDVIASIPIIPYDIRVAVEHAHLLASVRRAGRPRGAHDLLIAATARATDRIVVTADESAFVDLPDVDYRKHR
jgi:tRNA(fMet)-specific endonuclease VapC